MSETSPAEGSSALLQRLMAEKTDLENQINSLLEKMYPQGADCFYRTSQMKEEKHATVYCARLYCGHPTVLIIPPHTGRPRNVSACFVDCCNNPALPPQVGSRD